MFRNSLAIIGFIALISYFKPQIAEKIPLLHLIPLPEVNLKEDKKDSPKPKSEIRTDARTEGDSEVKPEKICDQVICPPGTKPQKKATNPKRDSKWGIHFEIRSENRPNGN